ncbi:MAG: MFS transporter [Acidobacteria bacterium]|nr:MFS transporter [Acidobacteriota bacterium]
MTAYLRQSGAPVAEIGVFMSALIAPWTLKWLWAPLVDLIRPKRFGPNRTWIVVTQTMMALTLGVLFFVDPVRNLGLLSAFMVVHNVFAATQDVAIDGFAVRVLPESEMGWANGLMFAGQNLGMAVGGGGSLFIASHYGFNAAFALVLAVLAFIILAVSLRIREEPEPDSPIRNGSRSWLGELGSRLKEFFHELYQGFFLSGPGPRFGVLFAILPLGAMALSYGIASALQVDLGFTQQQISASTTITLLAAAAGCSVAGLLGDRMGLKPALALSYVLTVVPTAYLAYAILLHGMEQISFTLFVGCAVVHRLGLGVMYGVSGAVFMSMTNPAVGATQFTGYNSLHNVAIMYAGYWQGLAAAALGYGKMLGIDAALGLLPIALIPLLRPSRVRAD